MNGKRFKLLISKIQILLQIFHKANADIIEPKTMFHPKPSLEINSINEDNVENL